MIWCPIHELVSSIFLDAERITGRRYYSGLGLLSLNFGESLPRS